VTKLLPLSALDDGNYLFLVQLIARQVKNEILLPKLKVYSSIYRRIYVCC
jgi:hypothetical protein